MKRILILGDAGSAHLAKWVLALHGKYFEIAVFSLTPPARELEKLPGLRLFVYGIVSSKFSSSVLSKFAYLKALPELKKSYMLFQPDIVHAHYASSYGLLGALLRKRPFIISAWGSDVFEFGNSFIGSTILKFNFRRADAILSTSLVMKERIKTFTSKPVEITPFGVDTNVFYPGKEASEIFDSNVFVFGMVKSMEKIYGVDLVLRAFQKLILERDLKDARLLLVGGGSLMDDYRKMAKDLGLQDLVHFAGRINHEEIPKYHRRMDAFLNPSHMESFGVSVLEAMACGKAVIASNVGGLAEIITDQFNGLLVHVNDANELKEKMSLLYSDAELRRSLGESARTFVEENYNWKTSVDIMVHSVYNRVLHA